MTDFRLNSLNLAFFCQPYTVKRFCDKELFCHPNAVEFAPAQHDSTSAAGGGIKSTAVSRIFRMAVGGTGGKGKGKGGKAGGIKVSNFLQQCI